ncbi:MAG: DUF333 domain-containing protein [Chakrabartia sp.]
MRLNVPLILMCLAGCTSLPPPPKGPQAGMANPASIYCEQKGGSLRIEKDAQGGEQGVCRLPDGQECEEWALFRQACPAGLPSQEQPGQSQRPKEAHSAV